MSPVWFVTGTDTGVGKTVVTAAVVAALLGADRSPYVVKPAQTGVIGNEPGDLDEVRRLVGGVPGHEGIRLRAPLAPGTAARLENVPLPGLIEQRDAIISVAIEHHVVVEGAGGVLVPLGENWDLLHLATAVALTGVEVGFLVVARAGLGTLNHTALTAQAIGVRGIDAIGVVIGSWPQQPDLAAEQNLIDLPGFTGLPMLGSLPEGAGAMEAADFRAAAPSWLQLPLPG
jgi:dethiobiotin synthetase